MVRSTVVVVVVLTFFSCLVSARNQKVSDPQALSYAAQAMAALTGGTAISDVTLTGNVTWNESGTGTATLMALGIGESRMDLALTDGTLTEIRDSQTGVPRGKWIAPNNAFGSFALHNCWTDAVWFFPALGSLAVGPNVVLSYIGQETRNGGTVQHLQSYVYPSLQFSGTDAQQLSTIDFYLDAVTFLPVAITFNEHPDNDENTNLLIETDYSNYQAINGVVVPMRIQKYQQGNLIVDVIVSGASFNTGLSLSTFTIN